jgi:hypothetical protein
MNAPPVISQPPLLPTAKKPFALQAAQASVLSPLIAVGVSIVVNVGMGGQTSPLMGMITGGLSILLIVLGFVFGIIALSGVRRHGRKGILGRAIAGIIINGFLIAVMILSIPAWRKAAARAKQAERQNIEQHQQTPP